MEKQIKIIHQLNKWGKQKIPFFFLIDFHGKTPLIFPLDEPQKEILWKIPGFSNEGELRQKAELKTWKATPVLFEKFKTGFNQVIWHIHNWDTYLLNYTQPTQVETNLSLEEIFHVSSAPYKIFLKDKFVCFSPETFVKTGDGKIYSFPMKGTIDADIENAEQIILNDSKEIAEHNTIVDLIRNDLSLVAENVTVDKFRYLSHIKTNHKNLWQVSSQISGDLPENYNEKIGDIIFKMLPAGSISGAPKKKTLEIIEKTDEKLIGGFVLRIDDEQYDASIASQLENIKRTFKA